MPNYAVNITNHSVTLEMSPGVYTTFHPTEARIVVPDQMQNLWKYEQRNVLRQLYIAPTVIPVPAPNVTVSEIVGAATVAAGVNENYPITITNPSNAPITIAWQPHSAITSALNTNTITVRGNGANTDITLSVTVTSGSFSVTKTKTIHLDGFI